MSESPMPHAKKAKRWDLILRIGNFFTLNFTHQTMMKRLRTICEGTLAGCFMVTFSIWFAIAIHFINTGTDSILKCIVPSNYWLARDRKSLYHAQGKAWKHKDKSIKVGLLATWY